MNSGTYTPLTGVRDLAPAPYKLRLSDNGTKADVLDKSSNIAGRISCPEMIYDAQANNEAVIMLTRKSPDVTSPANVYSYKIGDQKCRLVARRVDGFYEWKNNRKYLVCKEQPLKAPVNGPVSSRLRNPVKIILLDASKAFKPVFSTGEYSGDYIISPDGNKIAYLELSKDEYGDMGNFVLKIANIRANRVRNIVTNRRTPRYLWCGNDALAITLYDKRNIPTLNRYALDTGRIVPLVTDRDAAAIELDKYNASTGEITYKTYPTNTRNPGDAVTWVVRTGGKPHKPVPPKNGTPPGMMPGPGMPMPPGVPSMPMPPGMPGMPPPPVK